MRGNTTCEGHERGGRLNVCKVQASWTHSTRFARNCADPPGGCSYLPSSGFAGLSTGLLTPRRRDGPVSSGQWPVIGDQSLGPGGAEDSCPVEGGGLAAGVDTAHDIEESVLLPFMATSLLHDAAARRSPT